MKIEFETAAKNGANRSIHVGTVFYTYDYPPHRHIMEKLGPSNIPIPLFPLSELDNVIKSMGDLGVTTLRVIHYHDNHEICGFVGLVERL